MTPLARYRHRKAIRGEWHNRFGHPDHRIAYSGSGYICIDCGQQVELADVTPTWSLGWMAYWYKRALRGN